MKPTSIAKLSEIYSYLVTSERPDLAQLCTDIIRAEQDAVKKGKFNIYNYVYKDKTNLRPVMEGAFHDDGNIVASDAHIMVVIKEQYPEELEGKTVLPDGSFLNCSYPKWRRVIPEPEGYKPYRVDTKKFYEYVAERRAAWKADFGKGRNWDKKWNVQVGPSVLRAEMFDKFLVAMDAIGADEILVKDRSHAVYAKTDKGLVLLMPVMIDYDRAEEPCELA